MNRENIAWAAGLYEGEGSCFYRTTKPKKTYNYQRAKYYFHKGSHNIELTVVMTDYDVLYQFWEIVNVGNLTGPHTRPNKVYKSTYDWSTAKFEYVQYIIAMFWPWLGERRRAQYKEALAKYLSYGRLSDNGNSPSSRSYPG